MHWPPRVRDASLAGTQVLGIDPAGGLRVEIVRTAPPVPNTSAVQAAWDALCAANPRFFDGGLLSVLHIERTPPAGSGDGGVRIHARPDRFARLAVQPAVATGVRILSVTAICTAGEGAVDRCVLLGKRSRETRIYGGMWELGPSGGIGLPPPALRELDVGAIWSHLADEVHEEIGIDVAQGEPIAITRDSVACSDDVVFHCHLGSVRQARQINWAASWEYEDATWVRIDDIARFDRVHASEIIAPTRALFRGLGWVGNA